MSTKASEEPIYAIIPLFLYWNSLTGASYPFLATRLRTTIGNIFSTVYKQQKSVVVFVSTFLKIISFLSCDYVYYKRSLRQSKL
jgi:hypothetical protein